MPVSTAVPHGRATLAAILAGLMLLGTSTTLLPRHNHNVTRADRLAAAGGVGLHAPLPAQTIVAVGDSITKGDWDTAVVGGWVTRLSDTLRRTYPGTAFVVRNAGVDGDRTAGVLARLARDVLARRPTLVIVSIGTNDFDGGVPPRTFAAELHLLAGRLRAAPSAPAVVLASMLPIAGLTPARLAAERAYNDSIRRTAAAMHVGYLDLFDMWLALGWSYLHLLRHDSEHPNPLGYAWLASTTATFLEAGYLDGQGRMVAPSMPPTCSAVLCSPSPLVGR
jgi:lysophospholipase L1-like esterase